MRVPASVKARCAAARASASALGYTQFTLAGADADHVFTTDRARTAESRTGVVRPVATALLYEQGQRAEVLGPGTGTGDGVVIRLELGEMLGTGHT